MIEGLDFNMLSDLISNNIFPIFCCLYMMTTNTKIVRENTEATKELHLLIKQLTAKVG